MYKINKYSSYNELDALDYKPEARVVFNNLYDGSTRNVYKFAYIYDGNDKILLGKDINYASKFNNGLCIIRKGNNSYLINSRGAVVNRDDYCDIEGPYNNSYIGTLINEPYKVLINKNGLVISNKYEEIDNINDELFLVKINNLEGVIDYNGKIVYSLSDNKLLDSILDKYYSIDSKDEEIKNFEIIDNNNKYITNEYGEYRVPINNEFRFEFKIPNSSLFVVYDDRSKYGYRFVDIKGNVSTESFYSIKLLDDNVVINDCKIIKQSDIKLSYNVFLRNNRHDFIKRFDNEEDRDNYYDFINSYIMDEYNQINDIKNKVILENRYYDNSEIGKIRFIERHIDNQIENIINSDINNNYKK